MVLVLQAWEEILARTISDDTCRAEPRGSRNKCFGFRLHLRRVYSLPRTFSDAVRSTRMSYATRGGGGRERCQSRPSLEAGL